MVNEEQTIDLASRSEGLARSISARIHYVGGGVSSLENLRRQNLIYCGEKGLQAEALPQQPGLRVSVDGACRSVRDVRIHSHRNPHLIDKLAHLA
jgi:hypothetical protein